MNVCWVVLLFGLLGIGKIFVVYIVVKLEGYILIELNVSDVCSKKFIEVSLKDMISNFSLDVW